MKQQNQWLFEAPFTLEILPEVNPYTALEFEGEWELSGRTSFKQSSKASWLQTLLPLLNRHRGNIPLDFLLGWIAVESNGRIGELTKLNERGYFQIHPGESKTLRLNHVRLSTDPDYSVKSGIQLIQHYGKVVQNQYKIPYGTDLFWHIVKLRHWLPGGVKVILKDMRELGVKPTTWEKFKQHVVKNRERIRQRITREYKGSWDPMQGITNVDKVFDRGRQLAKGLTTPLSSEKPQTRQLHKEPQPQINTALPVSGLGFYTYKNNVKQFGLPETIKALIAIAAAWKKAHPEGPRIGIGDISLKGGRPIEGHKSHQHGVDVDIRAMPNDGQEKKVLAIKSFKNPYPPQTNVKSCRNWLKNQKPGRDFTYYSDYSPSLTQELVNIIRANGILNVEYIFFKDPAIQGVSYWPNHNNHLHIRFYPPGK